MIKKLCLVFTVLIVLNVQSQEGTTSPYSFYGIGSLKFKGTAENRSMGGLSIYSDSIHINLRNPASYGGSNLASLNNESRPIKFTVGGSHTSLDLETNSFSGRTSSTTFDYLALSIPIGKFGFGFGLLPFTSVGYKLEFVDEQDVLTHRFRGEGGVNKAFLGFGYLLANNLTVGLDASYNFGNIQNNAIKFVYDDEGVLLQYQSREKNRSDLSGVTFNLGLSYNPMITDKLQLTSALTFTPKADLTSHNERTFASIVINNNTGQEFPINEIDADLEADDLKTTTLTLPSKTAFGLGIGQPRKWFVGAEYTFLKTSQLSNELYEIDNTIYEDASTITIGGFFIPQYNSFSKYFKRAVYRAGIRFENTGLNILDESINEFGISFGVGLPIGTFFSNANIGVEFGKRGTINKNLVQEKFINLQISLSLNDRWFQKRKFN